MGAAQAAGAGGGATPGAGEEAGPRVLTSEECWARLRARAVGRMAVVADSQPLVVPLNYVVDGDVLVVRTGEGVVHASAVGSRVAFQVDDLDERSRSGWTVLVRALAVEADDRVSRVVAGDTRATRLQPWAPGRREHWLRLVPHGVSGRQLLPRSPGDCAPLEGCV